MPFYSALLGFISAVLLVCLLVTALVSYLYGSVRIGQRELRISKAARIQLAVIAGALPAVQGASLWLDRYKTLVEPGDRITGPGYTGVNADHPRPDDPRDRRRHRGDAVLRHRHHRPLALPADRHRHCSSSRRSCSASATRGSCNTFQVSPNQLALEAPTTSATST